MIYRERNKDGWNLVWLKSQRLSFFYGPIYCTLMFVVEDGIGIEDVIGIINHYE